MGRSVTLEELQRIAYELEIPPPDIPEYRFARPGAPPSGRVLSMHELRALEDGELATPSIPAGPMTSSAIRGHLRAVGINLGHERDDEEDRERTARHEAAHAAVAHSLGWTVTSVDLDAGQTRVVPPNILSQSLAERDLQHGVISAAASAFTGTSAGRAELGGDQLSVRMLGAGHIEFEEAQKRALRLKDHDYVKPLYQRLTAALLEHGRLEGAELRRVLEDEP